MKTIKLLVTGVILSALFIVSCEQTNNELTKTNDASIQSILAITDLYNSEDIELATSDDGTKATLDNPDACFNITIHENEDGAFWPRSWTLDFGGENCESINGFSRRGKIHVSLTDCWRNDGSLRSITYEDFFVNDVQLEGLKTVENTGLNETENMTWLRKTTGGKLTFADSTTITWDCERKSELVIGGNTWLFRDDVYLVTGGGTGVNQEGISFSTDITVPLEYVFGCRFPVSGEITITVEGSEPVIINYGDGECDKKATQTIGTEKIEIELGR